ncbi:MAG: hypothetical protein AB7V50_08155 [Vampirovibrionia bacterium]
MVYIRHIIGSLYILAILILAFTVLYYIFAGFIPPVLASSIEPAVSFLDLWSFRISFPVAVIIEWLLKYLTFLNPYIPVTDTGILNAQIHWVPLIALFIYSGILKFIDDKILQSKVKKIKEEYDKEKANRRKSLFDEE